LCSSACRKAIYYLHPREGFHISFVFAAIDNKNVKQLEDSLSQIEQEQHQEEEEEG